MEYLLGNTALKNRFTKISQARSIKNFFTSKSYQQTAFSESSGGAHRSVVDIRWLFIPSMSTFENFVDIYAKPSKEAKKRNRISLELN